MTPEQVDLLESLAPAVFGLVGVLVGGLITAGVEWWKVARQEKAASLSSERERLAAVRQAARLVSYELASANTVLEVARTKGNALTADRYLGPPEAWGISRPILATHLSATEWADVSRAVNVISRFMQLKDLGELKHQDAISSAAYASSLDLLQKGRDALKPYLGLEDDDEAPVNPQSERPETDTPTPQQDS